MFRWIRKTRKAPKQATPPNEGLYKVPTVKFDPSTVTDAIKADLRNNIGLLEDIDASQFDMIYEAALRSIVKGRALHVLFDALMAIEGMEKGRASAISRSLNNKATALIEVERSLKVGIEYSTWRYSGAPCGNTEQDAIHKAANGKRYLIAQGMLLDGRWTHPGYEDECKCVSRPIMPGFT